ncbi:MAG: serine/threonine-protein kinase [Pseudomonadota bacterium]|nr:serine/threonine-protein kinase [Pseudomonadota bacterium]
MTRDSLSADALEVWRQADAAFDRLLDTPAAERIAALESMHLAPPVQKRVFALLQADTDSVGMLDAQMPAPSTPASPLRGRRFGRWTLCDELGRGGMAVVYRGECTTPDSTRQAAIKLLTMGALGGGGMDRFRQEQSILARLNHPHIAPLFDAGIADDGTPWLAMALVDGVRIDRWCREHVLCVRDRIRLFLDVCKAVAHAHANLVIHRDLKPSNVMVDREGHVRLLDFGIARQSDLAADAPTLTEWRALSPHYAAPEQFSGAPAAIGMDIYGLGALLYHLLVGRPPRAGTDALDELPTAPSRMQPLNDATPMALDARTTESLRGDLDAIVLKCLQPQPAQRYATVGELIDDIERWQTQRVVRARSPSARYRFGRFLLRHRRSAIAGVALLLAILIGAAAAIWQAGIAARQAQRAQVEKQRAEQSLQFVEGLLLNEDRSSPRGTLPDTATLLERGARDTAAAFADDPEGEARMLSLIGRVLTRTERFETGLPMLRRAFELRNQHLTPNDSRVIEAALVLTEAEIARNPMPTDAQRRRLSASLDRLDARRNSADAGRMLAALANLSDRAGDVERSLADYDRAISMLRSDHETKPELLAEALSGRGSLLAKLKRTEPGLRDLQESLQLTRRAHGDQHWDTVDALRVLGIAQVHANQAQARATLQQALSLADAIAPEPNLMSADIAGWLGARESSHGGRPDLAVPIYQRVVAIRTKLLGAQHPETLRARGDLGTVARAAGDHALAERELAEVRRSYDEAGQQQSVNYGILLRTLATLYLDRGELDRAERTVAESRKLLSVLVPTVEPYVVAPIAGQLLLLRGHPDAACTEFERGLGASAGLPTTDQNRLGIEQMAADCWRRLGRLDDAGKLLDDVAMRAHIGLAPGHPRIGSIALARAELALARGDEPGALGLLRDAESILLAWRGTPKWQRDEITRLRTHLL